MTTYNNNYERFIQSQKAAELGLTKDLVRDYGASGIVNTTTAKCTAGSNVAQLSGVVTLTNQVNQKSNDGAWLTEPGILELQNGQPVVVYGVGDPYPSPTPQSAPVLSISSNSSSTLPTSTNLYVGYAWVLDNGETTPVSPLAVTQVAAGEQIIFNTNEFPGIATGLMIYIGETPSVELVGQWTWGNYPYNTGGTDSSNTGVQFPIVGKTGIVNPMPANIPGNHFYMECSIFGLANNATPIYPVTTTPTPSMGTPNYSIVGATGSTEYQYAIAAIDGRGGYSQASTPVVIPNGGALNINNYVELSWGWVLPTAVAVWKYYQSAWSLVAVVCGNNWRDYGSDTDPFPFIGYSNVWHLPSSPPSAPGNQVLSTTVVSGGGTSTLVLADVAQASVSGVQVVPNDGSALNAFLTDALTVAGYNGGNGGKLHIPAGHYWMDPESVAYLDSTGFQVPQNLVIEGDGTATVLHIIPGCNNRGLLTTQTGNSVQDCIFRDLLFEGGGDQGGIGFACVFGTQECLIDNVTWDNCWDGGNFLGHSYTSGSYMSVMHNCRAYNNNHLATAIKSAFITNYYSGNNGFNQVNSYDGMQGGIWMRGDCKMEVGHVYSCFDAIIASHQQTIISHVDFDDDNVRYPIHCLGGAWDIEIGGCEFFSCNVPNSGLPSIQFDGQSGFSIGNLSIHDNRWANLGSPFGPWEYTVSLPNNGVDHHATMTGNTWNGSYYGASPVQGATPGVIVKGNDVDMYLGPVTPAASPFVSATVYQNTYGAEVDVYQAAYATTAGTAGTVAIALGSGSTPPTIMTIPVSGATSSTSTQQLPTLTVPPLWYYSFTLTDVTLPDATVIGR